MSKEPVVCAEDAYYLALQIKQKTFPPTINTSLDELAQIILHKKNLFYLYAWANNIGTHLDEIAQVILQSRDVNYMANWCLYVQTSPTQHIPFKLRALELGKVDKFVDAVNRGDVQNFSYSVDDFYSDLPLEARIGVLV